MKHYSQSKWLLSFLFILVSTDPLHAQNPIEAAKSTELRPSEADLMIPQKRHHAGWGVSFAEGDATLGRDEGELLFSTFYSYSLSKNLDIELALHYLPVQRFVTLLELTRGRDSLTLGVTAISWLGDVSLLWGNFSAEPFLRSLRIGGGLSLRTLSAVYQQHANIIIQNGPTMQGQFVYGGYTYTGQVNAGINLKAEYGITLSTTLDIVLRAQFHYLPVSLQTTNGRNDAGSYSIGGFLRFNW